MPAVTSLTKATTGTLQLSDSSVTTVMSDPGTSAAHCTFKATGLLAVGSVVSPTTTVAFTSVNTRSQVPLLTLVKFKVVFDVTPTIVTSTVPPAPIVAVPEAAPL